MAENLEPVLRLVVETTGYDGEEHGSSGTPGQLTVYPEQGAAQREIVEAVRRHAVASLDAALAQAAQMRQQLDFSLPNQPLREQVEQLRDQVAAAQQAAQVLCELAPWLYDDDDDDGDTVEPLVPQGSAHG